MNINSNEIEQICKGKEVLYALHSYYAFRQCSQVYPDVGVAAMLQNSWKDTDYGISSLTDRRPIEEDDDLIVLAAPDPQGMPGPFPTDLYVLVSPLIQA